MFKCKIVDECELFHCENNNVIDCYENEIIQCVKIDNEKHYFLINDEMFYQFNYSIDDKYEIV